MKEKLSYIHSEFESNAKNLKNLVYELPDGTTVTVPADPFVRGPEALFNPRVIEGCDHKGLAQLTTTAINKCDDELQTDLYASIVLAGGSSVIPGFADRLERDVIDSMGSSVSERKVSVIPDSQRKYAAWIGGSMFASLSTFEQIQITKHEYDDSKDTAVLRKCF